MNRAFKFLLTAAALALSGCVTLKTTNYSPKYELIDSIRLEKLPLKPLAVNAVEPSEADDDLNKISIRGGHFVPPEGTYASFIGNAFKADLDELGIYQPRASNHLAIEILKNELNAPAFSGGSGTIEIHLKILNANHTLFEKTYDASTQWEWHYWAATAVPIAQAKYAELTQLLTAKVFSDKAFLDAIQRGNQ